MKNGNRFNFLIVIAVILIAAGVAFFILTSTNNSNVKVLKINELKEKINNKESFILVISRDDCTHCKSYLPVINKIGKEHNVTFYDISQTGLNDEDTKYLKNVANIDGTPTTVFIVNGEEKSTTNRLVGNVPEYRVIEKLKAMGYINE